MDSKKYNAGMMIAAKDRLGRWLRQQRIEFLTDRETDHMLIREGVVIKPHFRVKDKTYIHVVMNFTPDMDEKFQEFAEGFGNILVIPVKFIQYHLQDYTKEDFNDYFSANI